MHNLAWLCPEMPVRNSERVGMENMGESRILKGSGALLFNLDFIV